MTAALTAPLVVICCGAAIDYAFALQERTALIAASDGASLAGVTAALSLIRQDQTTSSIEEKTNKVIQKYFTTSGVNSTATITNSAITTKDGSVFVDLESSAKVPTSFLRLVGIQTIEVTAKTQSVAHLPNYVRVNFLIDNSGSMGIGATAADQKITYDNTGCTIACHYNDTWGDKDLLATARASGAVLRMDVVKDAAKSVLHDLSDNLLSSSTVSVAVYTMSNSVQEIQASTTDLAQAGSAIDSIDLSSLDKTGGSNFNYSLAQFAGMTPAGGDGSSAKTPITYTVLMTDGMENSLVESAVNATTMDPIFDNNFKVAQPNYVFSWFETNQSMQGASCDPVKARNQKLLALNVEYLVPTIEYWQSRYTAIRDTIGPQIPIEMKKCVTSPDMVFLASSPDEIKNAAKLLAEKLIKPNVHLTQ